MRWYRVPAALALAGALSALASQARSAVLINVDKAAQQMTVVVDGELRWTWPVSTGLTKYDTPIGSFTTFRMERKHYSREWDDAPMPHSIFFTQRGHAIHGSYAVRRLGNPASHGCVRLAPKNAAQLFALVRKHGLANTQVVVQGALPGLPPMPIIAVPLPRERRAALQMVAKLEAPHVVRDDASTTVESKPGAVAAAAALPGQDRPAEELMVSTPVAAQAHEGRAALPRAAALDTPHEIERDTSKAAGSETGAAAIAMLGSDKSPEELAAFARVVTRPHDTRAALSKAASSDAHVAIRPDLSTIAESRTEVAAIATLKPEEPVEGRTADTRLAAQPNEHRAALYAAAEPAMPVMRSEIPAVARTAAGEAVIAARAPEALMIEQRDATRTIDNDLPRRAARAVPRPHALPEPPVRRAEREPPRQRAERKRAQRYAERTYDDPSTYRRSWSIDRPAAVQRRSPRFAPPVYYDPRMEIIEEVYINGQWVRHRYYRRARPWDFYRYR